MELAAVGSSTTQFIEDEGMEGLRDLLNPKGRGKYCQGTLEALQTMDHTVINNDLLVALTKHIVTKGANAGLHGASAVLIFMPGLKEITDLHGAMRNDPLLGDPKSFRLCPLHSSLATAEQKMVFVVPPAGTSQSKLDTFW